MSFQESIPGLATGIPVRQCRRVSGIKRRVFAAIHTRFGRDITPASAKIVRPDRGGISGDDPRAANKDLHCEECQDVGVNSDSSAGTRYSLQPSTSTSARSHFSQMRRSRREDRGAAPLDVFRSRMASSFANHPPLAFGIKQAEHPHMTSTAPKMNPTAGALRAASAIQHDASLLKSLPELIDRETGVREILEILQSIMAQAGDLIESRSPELVAEARAALARYHDDAPGQAE